MLAVHMVYVFTAVTHQTVTSTPCILLVSIPSSCALLQGCTNTSAPATLSGLPLLCHALPLHMTDIKHSQLTINYYNITPCMHGKHSVERASPTRPANNQQAQQRAGKIAHVGTLITGCLSPAKQGD
jgi:hypothetical protein